MTSTDPRADRGELFDTVTDAPYPDVQPLGASPLHGPPRDQHIVFVLGVGPGLGLAIARIFASQGYTLAIASRNKERLDEWAADLNGIIRTARGGSASPTEKDMPQCLAFACDVLSTEAIRATFDNILAAWPGKQLGTACFNASIRKRGPFLQQRPEQIRDGVQASIFGGFAYMQSAIAIMERMNGTAGGNILVTGATSSIRGRSGFAGFAASKGGLRQICQSVAREYGPKHIHVAHVIVDGLIDSQQARDFFGLPKGHRFGTAVALRPDEMAKTWLFLASQNESGWTFEMDLRPAKEDF